MIAGDSRRWGWESQAAYGGYRHMRPEMLKTSFDGFPTQDLVCKLLNLRSFKMQNFAEITALGSFSTGTRYFNT